MTGDQLLAEAASLDRQADAIFASFDQHAVDALGFRPLIPAGMEGRAEQASDLRRRAEWLRADAAALTPHKVVSVSPSLTSPSSEAIPPAAATPSPEPELDPVAALVERIMKA